MSTLDLSDADRKTLMENELNAENLALISTNRLLSQQLQLVCARLYELEKQAAKLGEPILITNKTHRPIVVSQIDHEYVAPSLMEISAGGQRLIMVDGRRWELS